MKSVRFLSVLVACVMLTAGVVAAKDMKIGFIDSEKIFGKFKGTEDAQKDFDKIQEQWKKEAEQMQQKLLKMREELENQSLLLSDEKKAEKARVIEKKYMEYQEFVNKIWGQNGVAYRKNAELTKPIMVKINAILKKIAHEENYSYIMDAAQGAIVYADPALDLTDRVVKELNREAK